MNGRFLKQTIIPIDIDNNLIVDSLGRFIIKSYVDISKPGVSGRVATIGLFDSEFKLLSEFFKETNETKDPSGRDLQSMAQYFADLMREKAFVPKETYILGKDDSLYFGYPSRYEINIYSPTGELKKVIKREYDPIKVSEKDIENFKKEWDEKMFKSLPIPDEMKKKAFQLAAFPTYKPAYESFALMDNGWLFVVVESNDNKNALIDLFDNEGKYIAQFRADIPTEGLVFKNGCAYAVALESDFKCVKRFKFEIQESR